MEEKFKYTNPYVILRYVYLVIAIILVLIPVIVKSIEGSIENESASYLLGAMMFVVFLIMTFDKRYRSKKEFYVINNVIYYNDGKETYKMQMKEVTQIERTRTNPTTLQKEKRDFIVFYGNVHLESTNTYEQGFIKIVQYEFKTIGSLVTHLKNNYDVKTLF